MTRLPEFTTDLTAFYSEQTPNGYDFSIAMPYLPELSVNRYKHFGTPFTKKIVRDWMETLGDLLMVLGGQLGIYWPEYKITVRIDGTFKDNHSIKRCIDITLNIHRLRLKRMKTKEYYDMEVLGRLGILIPVSLNPEMTCNIIAGIMANQQGIKIDYAYKLYRTQIRTAVIAQYKTEG